MSWNCLSISNKKHELLHFLQEHNIDIALIQDTFLKPGKRFKIPNYSVYRDDKVGAQNGGTLILAKRSLSHNPLSPSYNLVSAEASTVTLTMANNSLITISSVYQRSDRTHPVVPNDYEQLFGPDNQVTILGGDFNAKSVLWGNLTTNRNGIDLNALQQRLLFSLITPDEPTFIGRGRPDFLDMFLVRNLNLQHNIQVLHELSSDHLPIVLTLGNPADRSPDTFIRKATDWIRFQQHLHNTDPIPRINNPQELDAAVDKLTTDIQQAISHATVTRTLPVKMHGKLPANIKELIREKNRIRRRATRTGDPNIKRLANQHTELVREALYQFHNDRWDSKLEDLNLNPGTSLWKMARAISNDGPSKIPTLRRANSSASSPQEKADLFAEMLEDRFQPNPHTHPRFGGDAVVADTIRVFNQTPFHTPQIFTTPQTVKSIIRARSVRKAPGHDKITVKSLKELPAKQIAEIVNIINSIFRLSYFPSSWKKAEIVMIRKPGSPSHEADSYRPISLISTLGKLAERVVLEEIGNKSAELRIIPDEQFGFQPRHGTIHHTAKLAQFVSSSFNRRFQVGAVFLDVSKAFDKVWHEGLILKLIRFGFPRHLTALIQSFLSGRTFQVRVEQSLSEVRRIRAGVPQGSVLSPHLFNIFTSDIPKDRDTTLQLYADDTAISTSARNKPMVAFRLQRHLTNLSDWFDRWRIKVNPAKTQAIYFGTAIHKLPPQLSLNGTRLRWAKCIKYLGLLYDKRLVWKDQAPAAVRKANQLLGKLYPLLNRRSKLSTGNKLMIYKSIVRAGLTYACQTWCQMSKTHRAKVQTVQNKALRIIAGAPWFVRNNQLHREFEMPTIKEFTRNAQLRFLEKAAAHPNPEIANTFRGNADIGENRYLRPTDILPPD